MNNDESALIQSAQSGERSAFRRLVEAHSARVHAVAWRWTGDAEDARDVAQQAFVRLFEQLRRLDPARPLRPWLSRVASNLAVDCLRRRSLRREVPWENATTDGARSDGSPGPSDDLEAKELRLVLARLCESLSPQQRDVFVLRDLEDVPVAEIATQLECSASTVRVHLAAARRRLRAALERHHPEYAGKGRT